MSRLVTPLTRQQQAISTIDDLRERFPDSGISSEEGNIGEYCVGGALGRGTLSLYNRAKAFFYGMPTEARFKFPATSDLADTLQTYNELLTQTVADNFANRIITANDEGKQDLAWMIAEDALAWPDVIERDISTYEAEVGVYKEDAATELKNGYLYGAKTVCGNCI